MSWWHRHQAWQLESRARYVTTAVGLRALIVFLASWLYYDSPVGETLVLTATFAAVGILLWWFWYYPRAKAKSQHRPVAARTTPG